MKVRGKKRRWLWIAGIAVAVLILLIGALVLVLRFTSPPPLTPAAGIEPTEIPTSWLASSEDPTEVEAPSAVGQPSDEAELTTAAVERGAEADVESVDTRADFDTLGSIIFYGDGRAFGEETYSLHIDAEGGALRSTGEFRFKVVLATIRLAFEQSLQLDADLVPLTYAASYDAPLGMGREVRIDVTDRETSIGLGEEARFVTLTDRTVIQGTFSTYALLPYFMTRGSNESERTFDVLVLGGPPGDNQNSEALPTMRIEQPVQLSLLARGQEILVDGYTVRSDMGETLLLAKGAEFLALLAAGEEGSLAAIRSDLFPDGFELEASAAVPENLAGRRFP